MLFMVIEQFRPGAADATGARFATQGRLMPHGVTYHSSWIDPAAHRCFQLMEARGREALHAWVAAWTDLVAFEVIPVVPAADFWAARSGWRSCNACRRSPQFSAKCGQT